MDIIILVINILSSDSNKTILVLFLFVLLLTLVLILLLFYTKRKKHNKKEMNVDNFFSFRNHVLNIKQSNLDWKGVYVLYNQNKNLYYVGQAEHVLNRINMHFTGKGNGDVYSDYKQGDKFIIRYELLKNSSYKTLNELERKLILKYDAQNHGYNKTKGNKDKK